jgi:ATP-dependent Lon protease
MEQMDMSNNNEDQRFAEPRDYEVPALLSEEFVLFPGMEIVTVVNEKRGIMALREALREHQILAFIPSTKKKSEVSAIGTLAIVKKAKKVPAEEDGEEEVEGIPISEDSLELKGMWRIKIKKIVESSPGYPRAIFERAGEIRVPPSHDPGTLVDKVQGQIDEFVELIPEIPPEIVALLKQTNTPGELADLCANSPEFTHEEKVDLLETLDQEERLNKVTKLFEKQLKALKRLAKVDPISECEKCLELADKAFDSDPSFRAEIAVEFLNHVVRDHTGELLALLAEKYLPIFMNKRSMR